MINNAAIENQGSFGYHGQVTVKRQIGSRVHTLFDAHNEGLPHLFDGLCQLFAGTGSVKDLIPTQIAFYSLTGGASPDPDDIKWENLQSSSILIPVLDRKVERSPAPMCKLQFRAPTGQIGLESISVLALFPSTATSPHAYDKALAIFKLAKGAVWQSIQIGGSQQNALDDNFVVEWQLDFTNIKRENT